MRVSIVVPCYNAAPWIGAALESALAQTHPDVEVIVVDDGSSDTSWEIVQGFGARVRAERIAHAGGGRARNRGLELATGRYILFLDADDLIAPDTIASLLAALASAPPRSIAVARWL